MSSLMKRIPCWPLTNLSPTELAHLSKPFDVSPVVSREGTCHVGPCCHVVIPNIV